MENTVENSLYKPEGGLKLIKTFSSLEKLINGGTSKEFRLDVFRITDPASVIQYSNIFQYEARFSSGVSLRRNLNTTILTWKNVNFIEKKTNRNVPLSSFFLHNPLMINEK
tara:strand:- start:13111 stop:13443 length:333 start_codon:yes stop_codon:yes gene_type:complete